MKFTVAVSLIAMLLTGCVTTPTTPSPSTALTLVPPMTHVPLPVTMTEPLPVPIPELRDAASVTVSPAEVTCIATAMIAEAGGESETGMVAVGYVILNRMGTHARNHRQFRATACGVVYQRDHTRSGRIGCQFSWVCHPTGRDPKRHAKYSRALELARQVMEGSIENPIDDSVFFNVRRLRPAHTRGLPLRAQIGNHNFFAAKYAVQI